RWARRRRKCGRRGIGQRGEPLLHERPLGLGERCVLGGELAAERRRCGRDRGLYLVCALLRRGHGVFRDGDRCDHGLAQPRRGGGAADQGGSGWEISDSAAPVTAAMTVRAAVSADMRSWPREAPNSSRSWSIWYASRTA